LIEDGNETLPVHSDEENGDDDFEAAEIEDEDVDLEEEAVKIQVGFNVAVMSDVIEKGDPFFLILCNKVLFFNPKAFTDDWGNEWPERDMLTRGFYYERISAYQRGQTVMYKLIQEKEAFAASQHVLCSDFPMLPAYTQKGLQRYNMSLEVREKKL
jgi:hypothetical protein